MVKTFQLRHDGLHGSSIKVAPITTQSVLNQDTCLKVEGDGEMIIQPQTILPDTHGMEVSDCLNLILISYVNFQYDYYFAVYWGRNDKWSAM